MTQGKKAAILRAIKTAKASEFGVTAIKVELEANLNRHWSTDECHGYMMEQLSVFGLAAQDGGTQLSHGDYTDWNPVAPLQYAEFYNDGSVDSEFTFTIMLDKPENVFLVPKVIQAFKRLAKELGQGMDTRGAGMHTAFLYSGTGSYPIRINDDQRGKFSNYRRSMRMLLPALFFLATNKDTSRGLNFRQPNIGIDTHRAAVDFRGGALEFRVFDTCYNKPETILDNIVVMANTLKYWSKNFKRSGVEKISRQVNFGVDNSNRLDRFYTTYTHIDLLNFGLERLKPSYYTIKELKAQRKFNVSKRELSKKRKEHERAATNEYAEYQDRFNFRLVATRMEFAAQKMRDMQYELEIGEREFIDPEEARIAAEEEAEKAVEAEKKRKKSIKRYVTDRLREIDSGAGQYRLTAE